MMGYGIPSTQPYDEGSFLGKLGYGIAGGNEKVANVITRLIYESLLALCFIYIAFINLPVYILYVISLIAFSLTAIMLLEGKIKI